MIIDWLIEHYDRTYYYYYIKLCYFRVLLSFSPIRIRSAFFDFMYNSACDLTDNWKKKFIFPRIIYILSEQVKIDCLLTACMFRYLCISTPTIKFDTIYH